MRNESEQHETQLNSQDNDAGNKVSDKCISSETISARYGPFQIKIDWPRKSIHVLIHLAALVAIVVLSMLGVEGVMVSLAQLCIVTIVIVTCLERLARI